MYGLGLSVGNLASKSVLSSAFDPLLLSGLLAWYSPDDVVVDGSNNITQANDKTGNGYHMVQNGADNVPSLVSTGFGGSKQAFLFESTNSEYLVNIEGLANAMESGSANQPFTHVYVMGYADGYFPGSFDSPYSIYRNSNFSTYNFQVYYNGIVGYPRLNITTSGGGASNAGDTAAPPFRETYKNKVVVYVYDGTNLTVWLDGVKSPNPTALSLGSLPDLDSVALGARYQPFNDADDNHWHGHMGDYLFFDAALADGDVAGLTDYLMTKFGITA